MKHSLWIVCLLAVVGCVEEGGEETEPSSASTTAGIAPLVGKADGFDSADRDCQVVLRQVDRRSDGKGGFEVEGSSWVWIAHFDVAKEVLEAGGSGHVLYQTNAAFQKSWWQVEGKPVEGASAGFQRFEARLDQEMVGPGMSGSSLNGFQIDLIPFVQDKGGSRHFDHNHLAGDFDLYTLTSESAWAKTELDTLVCGVDSPSETTITFDRDWKTQLDGTLVAGEKFSVLYDYNRLPECRNTHNGSPAWGLDANVLFLPSETLAEQSTIAFQNVNGSPTNRVEVAPATFAIPEGTTSVEIWFLGWAGGGSTCRAWDSLFGENYSFAVKAP